MPSDINQVQKATLKQQLQDSIMAKKLNETILDIKVNTKIFMHLTLHFSTVHISAFFIIIIL